MKICFVGVKRPFQEIPANYIPSFVRYHLELPWYFARDGRNEVYITTPDYQDAWADRSPGGGSLRCIYEEALETFGPFDVVIHWRKWFSNLYGERAVNVILCQDHSFDPE